MRKIIIAVDGYSGCGKSTTAKALASALKYAYIDTGAMYRAVTFYFDAHYVNLTNPKAIQQALSEITINFKPNEKTGRNETFLNGQNIEDEIRTMYISQKVSEVSALPDVRKALVSLQQKMGKKGGVVMDGRDIGTFVFPTAELKIFVTADPAIRVERRFLELQITNPTIRKEEIEANLQHRDLMDTTRERSPLKQAEDAIVLDNTNMTREEQFNLALSWALAKIG